MELPTYDPLALEPFGSASPPPWQWRSVQAERRTFALRAGDTLLAGLRFEKSSGALATADTAEGRFAFERTGFFRARLVVRVAGDPRELATFVPTWTGGGALQLAGGERFEWHSSSFFESGWEWRGADERVCARFEASRASKAEADVTVSPGAQHAPLLVTLGFHLWVLHADEMAAVSGTVGA